MNKRCGIRKCQRIAVYTVNDGESTVDVCGQCADAMKVAIPNLERRPLAESLATLEGANCVLILGRRLRTYHAVAVARDEKGLPVWSESRVKCDQPLPKDDQFRIPGPVLAHDYDHNVHPCKKCGPATAMESLYKRQQAHNLALLKQWHREWEEHHLAKRRAEQELSRIRTQAFDLNHATLGIPEALKVGDYTFPIAIGMVQLWIENHADNQPNAIGWSKWILPDSHE